VIEVKPPSNTKDQLHDHAMTTLAGQGSIEFWVVDQKEQAVVVYTKTSGIHVYRTDLAVPLPYFGGDRMYVRDIFLKRA
jgi:hypothetical protein